MRRHIYVALLLTTLVVSSGCGGGRWWPFTPQGTIHQQQSEALVHDPYPQRDIGPDDPGARPRDFVQPLPEPVRNRIVPQSQIWTRP